MALLCTTLYCGYLGLAKEQMALEHALMFSGFNERLRFGQIRRDEDILKPVDSSSK